MSYLHSPSHVQTPLNRGLDNIDLPCTETRLLGADGRRHLPVRLRSLIILAIGLPAASLQAQNPSQDPALLPRLFDFEAPDFQSGDLEGQRGWRVDQGVATVLSGLGWDSSAALSVEPAEPFTQGRLTLSRPVSAESRLFFDFLVRLPAAEPSVLNETFDIDSARIGLFRSTADPALAEWHVFHGNVDGDGMWLNTGVAAALDPLTQATIDWTRLTIMEDVTNQTWTLWVDGVLAAAGLGLQFPAEQTHSHFFILGDTQLPVILDNLRVSVENPPDLADLDAQPPAPPPDEDVPDGEPPAPGAEPLLDSDADGLPDAWEVANGLNADDPTDAVSDLDADGLTALDEFLLRSDPASQDIRRSVASNTAEVFNRFAGASARRAVVPSP